MERKKSARAILKAAKRTSADTVGTERKGRGKMGQEDREG